MNTSSWGLQLLNTEGTRECSACAKTFAYQDIISDSEGQQGTYGRDSLWAESMCSDSCFAEKMETSERTKKHAEEQYRVTNIEQLLARSGVPREHLKFQLINFDQAITPSQKKLLQFVSKCKYPFAKPVLVIGPAGTGKTHLAVALLREVILQGHCVNPLFITGVDLMSQLRRANDPENGLSADEIIARFSKTPFVVFDDIGVENITPYVLQSWYQIIDTRFSRGLSTVYTSNLSQAQCEEKFGPRITSRLFSGKIFEIEGEDMRIASGEKA